MMPEREIDERVRAIRTFAQKVVDEMMALPLTEAQRFNLIQAWCVYRSEVALLLPLYAKVVKERDALKEVLDDIYATCTDDFVTSKIAVSRSSRREGK